MIPPVEEAPNPRARHIQSFRRYSATPRITPEQSRRQSDVLRHAWEHFGAVFTFAGAALCAFAGMLILWRGLDTHS